MLRAAWSLPLLALAACPPRPVAPPVATAPGAASAAPLVGPGCPSAAGVFAASYLSQEPGKGRTGWVLPVAAAPLPAAGAPDYQVLDAGAAAIPAAPSGTLWLEADAPAPCHATLGHAFAAKQAGPPASLIYGYELDGCAAPADPQAGDGLVLVSDQAPTGCRIEAPRPAAARLGTMDAQQHWQPPAHETPVPAALAAIVPPHACTPPSCQPLWAVGEIDAAAGQPVAWGAAFNWLTVGDAASTCSWPAECWSGVFVAEHGAAVRLESPGAHALALGAALIDASGPKVLLAVGPGAYATYDLAAAGATLGHATTWMLAPSEAWDAVDRLGPRCAPKPAPLPSDAAPVSPYR